MSEHEKAQESSHTGRHQSNTREAQKAEGSLQSPTSSEGCSTRKPDRLHFLVADDNKTMRMLVTKLMDQLGYDCDLVVNGNEAVEAYMRGHPVYQCILMDVSMPVMDGIAAMRLIRTFESENNLEPSNIVALTTGIQTLFAEDRDRMRKLGFTTALRKPFRVNDLNSLVDELGLFREA